MTTSKNKITKEATIYKRNRSFNSETFNEQRNEFITTLINSKPRMNVKLIITDKSF